VATLLPDSSNRWLFERLEEVFVAAADCYGYEVSGLGEGLQLIRYSIADHFAWHTDMSVVGAAIRKVSMSVQLSEASNYSGGGLEFFGMGELPASRLQGSAITFPSFVMHRVAPLSYGLRWALVAWAVGPRFR
jgi:PKHD-type hydroxylase